MNQKLSEIMQYVRDNPYDAALEIQFYRDTRHDEIVFLGIAFVVGFLMGAWVF